MKIAVWKTGHIIADTVAEAVISGLSLNYANNELDYSCRSTEEYKGGILISDADIHLGYGILRGMDKVYNACKTSNKPFFLLDRGYWKPNHYEGFYRISLNGTQQTTGLDKIEPDYKRWDALGLEILPKKTGGDYVLICPPTGAVEEFFGKGQTQVAIAGETVLFRSKNVDRPLQQDLDGCYRVGTFNSSVGWEALRQGIPIVSDPEHSIVGSYQKLVDFPLCSSYDERRKLFGIMSRLQITLSEMKEGKLWPVIQELLKASQSTSVTTPAKL